MSNQIQKLSAEFPDLSNSEIRVKLASIWRHTLSKDTKNMYLTEQRKLMKIYKSKLELSKTKSTIKNIDDFLMEPMITALFHWNMEFGTNQKSKGDLRIVARGLRHVQGIGSRARSVAASPGKYSHTTCASGSAPPLASPPHPLASRPRHQPRWRHSSAARRQGAA